MGLVEKKKPGRLRRLYTRTDKGLLVLALLFLLSLRLFTPRVYASDEIKYFSYLHSIFFDHDVDFTNEYTYFYNTNPKKYQFFKESVLDKRNEIGLPPNEGPIGSALMWSPFYLVGHAAAYLGQALGLKSFKPDGYSSPYIWAVTLASLLYGFAGLVFCYLLVRQFVPRFYAALATAAVWFASPVIFYMSLTPPMSHANSLFVISLWLYLWYNTRGWRYDPAGNFVAAQQRTGSKWLLLGVLGGLMTMVREQDGTVLVVAAIESLFLYYHYFKRIGFGRLKEKKEGHETPLPSRHTPLDAGGNIPTPTLTNSKVWELGLKNGLFLLGFGLALVPQLLVYQALNGHPGPSKIVGDKLGFLNPAVFGRMLALLFDSNHGMFFWSPILLPATLGLIMMLRQRPLRLLAIGLIVAYLGELYISASFQTWTMAGSFGARRLVGISPAYIAGLAYLGYWLAEGKRGWHLARRSQLIAMVFFIVWNFGLIIQFSALRNEKDRQNLDFPRVVADQFTAVPANLITITQKFFFNRSSFYK